MGGLVVSISLAPTEPPRPISLGEVRALVWDLVASTMRQILARPAGRRVLDEYLPDVVSEWTSAAPEPGPPRVVFVFPDHAGTCHLSSEAAAHWTTAVIADLWPRLLRDPWGRERDVGCTIVPPARRIVTELVLGPASPLVYTRRGLLGVERVRSGSLRGRAAFGDDVTVGWDELRGRERDVAEWVAMTGHCQCDVCGYYRRWSWKVKDRYKIADHLAAARRAWALLEGGEQRALERDARHEVLAWDWSADRGGPPALAVLSDWLAQHEAPMPRDALAGMVANRWLDPD